MPPIRCYLAEETDDVRRFLRRVTVGDFHGQYRGHRAVSPVLDRVCAPRGSREEVGGQVDWPRDDPRWPTRCESCAYEFTDDDLWLLDVERIWRRPDTGEEFHLRDAAPGAMYWAQWSNMGGDPEAFSLCVILPGGHPWSIDGRANNCGRPDDRTHRCWCRHGDPPDVTVDKECDTCAAGAGSIRAGDYHGFLRDGWLVDA